MCVECVNRIHVVFGTECRECYAATTRYWRVSASFDLLDLYLMNPLVALYLNECVSLSAASAADLVTVTWCRRGCRVSRRRWTYLCSWGECGRRGDRGSEG